MLERPKARVWRSTVNSPVGSGVESRPPNVFLHFTDARWLYNGGKVTSQSHGASTFACRIAYFFAVQKIVSNISGRVGGVEPVNPLVKYGPNAVFTLYDDSC